MCRIIFYRLLSTMAIIYSAESNWDLVVGRFFVKLKYFEIILPLCIRPRHQLPYCFSTAFHPQSDSKNITQYLQNAYSFISEYVSHLKGSNHFLEISSSFPQSSLGNRCFLSGFHTSLKILTFHVSAFTLCPISYG